MSNLAARAQGVKKDDDVRITDEIEKDTLLELETGMSGERQQLPGMAKEYSGWDVYNNEAKKVDTELVNDWRDSLNSLLLFAAIFAAVLTAFVIESKKLLESDPSDVMLEVMIFFTNNMANGSFTPYSRPQFEPESSSITVNCFFFASLSASLVAALASVVALQWVADYDAAITRGGSSPEDRAKRRQFRYAGVVWWKMNEIIAVLPLLLYSSVVLFFSGLTLWMWTVHHTVGAVVAGGMGIAVLFYGTTTFLSVASVSAPFRTPLSRLIYSFVYLFFSVVDSLSRFVPIPSSQAWLKERHQRYTGAVKRDDDEVNRRHWLGMDALAWLASHLSISQDSYDRLLLLVNELRKQDKTYLTSPAFKGAPWFPIFDLLAWRNLVTAEPDQDVNKEEMRAVGILAHCYRIPAIYAIIRPRESMLYWSDDTENEYWSQGCDIAKAQWSPPSPSTSLNSLFLLLRDIPLPSKDTAKQIEFTIRFSRWRNSTKRMQQSLKDEVNHENSLPASSNTSAVVVGRFLKADEEDLWFTRDDRSLYQTAVGRMVGLYLENGYRASPSLLDSLRWRFESLMLGENSHPMDAIPCLSYPLLYYYALGEDGESDYNSLHSDFTLLLAKNLNSCTGAERARRMKELLTMMWISSRRLSSHAKIDEPQGMESFFNANRNIINEWVRGLHHLPHSHEILEHLSLAQAEQPDIGSLWRPSNSQVTLSDILPALGGFDKVIAAGVTPAQHLMLIDLVCRDIELGPSAAFSGNVDPHEVLIFDVLRDPCLKFIRRLASGVRNKFPEDMNLLKGSWVRIANHLMAYYEGTDSPNVLRLQASALFLVPRYMEELCQRALREPQALARVKGIFEYPVQCGEGHDIGEGHLLLHILEHIDPFGPPVDISGLTEFPMNDQDMYPSLAILILSDGYEELLRKEMHMQDIDRQCTEQLLDMISMVTSSQYSMLAFLSTIPGLEGDPADLVALLICINKALDLPDDYRAISRIRPLVRHVQDQIDYMGRYDGSEWAIAKREASKVIDRLLTYLARLRFSSRTNSRILACARITGSFDSAIGWLPPYVDENVIF